MAVSSYKKDEKTLWKVYLNIRSKTDPTIREQKVIVGLASEKAAIAEEKKFFRSLTEKMSERTSRGLLWEQVIERWESEMKSWPTRNYVETTIQDHAALMRNWTAHWLKLCAADLNIGDGRDLMKTLAQQGKPFGFQKKVKNVVNVIYSWGIEQKLIRGVHQSPTRGLKLEKEKEEKLPEILTKDQCKDLLFHGRRLQHPWYPIWAMALLTGMRSGELQALRWDHVDEVNRLMRVQASYNARRGSIKSTKAGYWRNVPISDELYKLLVELKVRRRTEEYVLPQFSEWKKGGQAKVLRIFCQSVGIPSIKFHTLRACWATQLLSNGIETARVMKIGGWKDYKTMMRYIRLAGVDERGATQTLHFLPDDNAVMERVVDLFEFKNQKPVSMV